MEAHELRQLSNQDLLKGFAAAVVRERGATATVLAYLGEVDARKLYASEGYSSMREFCEQQFGFSVDAAYDRIAAASAARRYPALLTALAEGQLHLTGVLLLAPYLKEANANSLLQAAAGKTKSEIQYLLAERFPRTEELGLVCAVPSLTPAADITVSGFVPERNPTTAYMPAPQASSRMKPIASERFELRVSFGRETQEKLEYARALLSHALPSGDLAEVLDRALDALIERLEKRKCGKTSKPRKVTRPSSEDSNSIPAPVRQEVWERDGGRCTFVGENGHRCGSRKFLQYDHIIPEALGGESTAKNLRLRCRAHNQLEAERAFGKEFMEAKRARAAELQAVAERTKDILSALRNLGCRREEARLATESAMALPIGASLEDHMRAAPRYIGTRMRR